MKFNEEQDRYTNVSLHSDKHSSIQDQLPRRKEIVNSEGTAEPPNLNVMLEENGCCVNLTTY